MSLAITAEYPYVFPPVWFFQKAALADHLILADTFHFPKRDKINRYRVLGFVGCVALVVPVRRAQRTGAIRDVELAADEDWPDRHWKTLSNIYKAAPFFDYYADEVFDLLHGNWRSLLRLAERTIDWSLNKLGLNVEWLRLSELAPDRSGDEALLAAAKKLGADTYVLLDGQKDLRNEDEFREAGVRVEALAVEELHYHRLSQAHCPSVSVLDLLVNEGPEAGTRLRQNVSAARNLRGP